MFKYNATDSAIYIAEFLCTTLLEWYHSRLLHPGIQWMLTTMQFHFAWPAMKKDIGMYKKHVQSVKNKMLPPQNGTAISRSHRTLPHAHGRKSMLTWSVHGRSDSSTLHWINTKQTSYMHSHVSIVQLGTLNWYKLPPKTTKWSVNYSKIIGSTDTPDPLLWSSTMEANLQDTLSRRCSPHRYPKSIKKQYPNLLW